MTDSAENSCELSEGLQDLGNAHIVIHYRPLKWTTTSASILVPFGEQAPTLHQRKGSIQNS